MNILAITHHAQLLDRLRTAFEGAGHEVHEVADPLQALANESWSKAHLILVDAKGDPLDGYRFCGLLRGESRPLFRNLPIFLVLDHPPAKADRARLQEADGDGFLDSGATIHRLLRVLGPLLKDPCPRGPDEAVALLACGLTPASVKRLREGVRHYGFTLEVCTPKELPEALRRWQPPILFQGLDRGDQALDNLRSLADLPETTYPVLVGNISGEAYQRKFLTAGALDWLPLPLSEPMVLHVVRRAMEGLHAKRMHQEYRHQIKGLLERRGMLEVEATALRSEVLTDALTDLLNRRAFSQHLEHAVNQWRRHRRNFVLLLGDLDYFKLINDRFGHLVGDQVLKAVAQRLRNTLRSSDLAFRIGGEEFAVILSETSVPAGLEVAEKIRRRVEESPVVLPSGPSIFPTISFGIGSPAEGAPGSGAQDFFARVDQALYTAKRKGRNRVETALPADQNT